ncbi:MAG: peroxiredoxin [Proteobacteria bacterium]|nr:peroxiredoxin [Pseudomonadota bacterium]
MSSKILNIGDKAPHFIAQSHKGEIDLNDYQNKSLILYFYPKDLTPGCTLQARDFQYLTPEFQRLNVSIIGVSRDSIELHNKFCEKEKIQYPLISDKDEKLSNLYGVLREKTTFGKKYIGIVRTTFIIRDGIINDIYENVKVSGHASLVLEKLKAHMVF